MARVIPLNHMSTAMRDARACDAARAPRSERTYHEATREQIRERFANPPTDEEGDHVWNELQAHNAARPLTPRENREYMGGFWVGLIAGWWSASIVFCALLWIVGALR